MYITIGNQFIYALTFKGKKKYISSFPLKLLWKQVCLLIALSPLAPRIINALKNNWQNETACTYLIDISI